jgi:hypothetical protein
MQIVYIMALLCPPFYANKEKRGEIKENKDM